LFPTGRLTAPRPPGRRPPGLRRRQAHTAARRAWPAATGRAAPGQRRRPLPRRLHLRGTVAPWNAAGTVDDL